MWIFKLEKMCVLGRWQLMFINKTYFGSTLSCPFPFLREEGSDVFLAMHVAGASIWWLCSQIFLCCLCLTYSKAWTGCRLRLYQVAWLNSETDWQHETFSRLKTLLWIRDSKSQVYYGGFQCSQRHRDIISTREILQG